MMTTVGCTGEDITHVRLCLCMELEARGSVVVKGLCYNPEDREFETRRGEFLNLPNPYCEPIVKTMWDP
jgi:hypothetical protein